MARPSPVLLVEVVGGGSLGVTQGRRESQGWVRGGSRQGARERAVTQGAAHPARACELLAGCVYLVVAGCVGGVVGGSGGGLVSGRRGGRELKIAEGSLGACGRCAY